MVVSAYLFLLIVGILLLLLPISQQGEGGASFTEAAFTATSVVCVTGLSVVDTATFWSGFGHIVIFVLCELGGLGVMTLTSLVLMRLSRRLGLRARASASTEVGGLDPGSVKSVVFAVGRVALIVQSVIAVLLTLRFYLHYDYDFRQSLWYGIFHSASAFNNLGFALFTDNLVGFGSDWWIIIPISVGIVVGGLGLPVLLELWNHRKALYRSVRHHRWTIHTRIMMIGTATLLIAGFGLFLLTEWTNEGTLGPLSIPGKTLAAIGLSVFPRTGGFNSVDVTELRSESWFVTDVLMYIGAGPAGTGGGLKITTVAVLAAIWITEVRGNPDTRVFDRTVSPSAQRGAIAVASAFTTTILVATGLMLAMTPYDLSAVFTEVTSAMSTVGLSTGITASLNTAEQFLLMVLMFIGRLGPITFATALALNTRTLHYSLPEERPYIG
ncbi:MAG: TrkH family potassium uptake protein [Actinobacteria bacterium]|nr:TrkH family potassium uptake protein [Actinomycetota bacterium]